MKTKMLDKVGALPSKVNLPKIRKYTIERNSSTNLGLSGPQNWNNPKIGSIDYPTTLKPNSRKKCKTVPSGV